MFIEAGVYFEVNKDHIVSMYYELGDLDFRTLAKRRVENAIKSTTTRFNTIEFFSNRSAIDAALFAAVSEHLAAPPLYLRTETFNLLSIDVPAGFEAAVLEKVIKQQYVLTLQYERTARLIEAQVKLIEAQATANVTIINSQAAANALVVTSKATADANVLYHAAMSSSLLGAAKNMSYYDATGQPTEPGSAGRVLALQYNKILRTWASDTVPWDVLINADKALLSA